MRRGEKVGPIFHKSSENSSELHLLFFSSQLIHHFDKVNYICNITQYLCLGCMSYSILRCYISCKQLVYQALYFFPPFWISTPMQVLYIRQRQNYYFLYQLDISDIFRYYMSRLITIYWITPHLRNVKRPFCILPLTQVLNTEHRQNNYYLNQLYISNILRYNMSIFITEYWIMLHLRNF